MSSLYNIIRRPIATEKSSAGEAQGKYTFEVATDANKHQIRFAVEKLFGVKVSAVNTANNPGKQKRFGRTLGRRASWKRATVTLKAGERIELFAAAAEPTDE